MTAKLIWVVDDGIAASLRLARLKTLHESVTLSRRAFHQYFAVFEVTFSPVCGKTPSVIWKSNCSRTHDCDCGFACRAEVAAKFVGPIGET